MKLKALNLWIQTYLNINNKRFKNMIGKMNGKIIFILLELLKNLQLFQVGKPIKEDEAEMCIELDPGMAFGTGDHPTTSMCLKAIEHFVKPDDSVIDVGTGSGILSIASYLLE